MATASRPHTHLHISAYRGFLPVGKAKRPEREADQSKLVRMSRMRGAMRLTSASPYVFAESLRVVKETR
jgi:hypothetical protein